jgi:surface protein
MFYECSGLKEVTKLDTSEVTDMYGMFFMCVSLKEVPKLDISKVTNMDYMFTGCSSIEYIPENFPSYDWSDTGSKILKENYPEYFI